MAVALVCREMGYTWEEYHSNPSWFNDIIMEMMKAEAKVANNKNK